MRHSSVAEQVLPFEKAVYEARDALREAGPEADHARLQAQYDKTLAQVYGHLTPWERILLARHPKRPRMLDYTRQLLEDFIELHGDRSDGDDAAMVCGVGRFEGETVFIVGQQKGVTTDEKVCRNFGMAHPSGYRKALRIFKLAERLGFPVLSLVDTPAAHPGIEAEEQGQGPAIANNLLAMASLRTPILSVVLSEGGSGGALGIALADRVLMLEYAVYMICPPERCAEILWRNVEQKDQAAAALRVSAADLYDLGVIDAVLSEGAAPAHMDMSSALESLRSELSGFLAGCRAGKWRLEDRQKRFQLMGRWQEEQQAAVASAASPSQPSPDCAEDLQGK